MSLYEDAPQVAVQGLEAFILIIVIKCSPNDWAALVLDFYATNPL